MLIFSQFNQQTRFECTSFCLALFSHNEINSTTNVTKDNNESEQSSLLPLVHPFPNR